jgi:two-component system sensor histidine kinase CssS
MKQKLFRQLVSIAVVMCGIVFFSLGILLPQVLLPVYEKNIYQYLKQPLELINNDIKDNEIANNVAYLYVTADNEIIVSDNLSKIITATPGQILSRIKSHCGKFKHLGKTYYYNTSYSTYVTKISLTDDEYINQIKRDVLDTIFPILMMTLLLILALILWWSRRLVLKIEHLKEKVDNLDNDEYVDDFKYDVDDELHALSKAIDDMRFTLREQDEYKNQMYQNISHDFKTPLTVIKSYIEAMEDGVQDKEKGVKIIKGQVERLELKVHSLLYLNKINYIKDSKNYKEEKIDVSEIIKSSVDKFKIQKPGINWEVIIGDKKTIFNGTSDMWEAIIDNILSNFLRYAEKEIKVTIKNNRIIFYNDGPNIDDTILDNIFTPYKKGIKGQFGLGLAIVKKTISLFGYEVTVRNEKKGVSFIIK